MTRTSRLTRHGWRRVFRFTGLLTAIAVVLSIIATNAIMVTISQGINVPGLIVSIVMPILLGTPSMLLIFYKHEQLRAANEQLRRAATTDWLTGCANRGAFTAQVSHLIAVTRAKGALLVLDVDHFKSVNDRFGHDCGDEALKVIATTISTAAGPSALVGRLGGEEFGVFLPGADQFRAEYIAEQLRRAVAAISFAVAGETCVLSISVGGAVFGGHTDFRSLYRVADQHLYQAKAAGRDRVALSEAA